MKIILLICIMWLVGHECHATDSLPLKLAPIINENHSNSTAVSGSVSSTNLDHIGSNNTTSQIQSSAITGGNQTQSSSGQATSTASQSINSNVPRQPVYTAIAPGLTAGFETCLGSASGGLQLFSVGLSGGKTTIDEDCVRRRDAAWLYDRGYARAALMRQCQDARMRQALIDSGDFSCDPDKVQALAVFQADAPVQPVVAQSTWQGGLVAPLLPVDSPVVQQDPVVAPSLPKRVVKRRAKGCGCHS